ncbi:carboxypeptidase-like regulatory domain-containing protein [Verrucomicrobiales bacterium]|nr:carboxypeptidase-like regulatory domain-containing protein [Verrucomicrobiales bacterium]
MVLFFPMKRRNFLKTTAVSAIALPNLGLSQTGFKASADSLVHGSEWESLNPGYWQIKGGALRRRLKNYGDRARRTGFPYHAETHGRKFTAEYDPSLPHGILWRRDWRLEGNYKVTIKGAFHSPAPGPEGSDKPEWKMYRPGYGMIGIAIGGQSLFEGYGREKRATVIGWLDSKNLAVATEPKRDKPLGNTRVPAPALTPGAEFTLSIEVRGEEEDMAVVVSTFTTGGESAVLKREKVSRSRTSGFVGVASRGLIDFEISDFEIEPGSNQPLDVGHSDCRACYPLGDSLKETDGVWNVKFVGVFASDGNRVDIRVSKTEEPSEGWKNVPVSGSAEIVNNSFRRNTAVVDVALPVSPSEATLYYTIWKDGVDVTADLRIGTDACGPGTGLVGDVPSSGSYVGRLPQLKAPYKICGLSCHAITSGLQQRTEKGFKMLGGGDVWQVRDQPTEESYKHLDEYNFQVMLWEDDVWYMELVLYPPSTDDAYKVVANSIFGPTSRWQMMRHWNVINPGDHDYGMDDVKGPEQIAIRKHAGLGQDPDYMKRNFQIVHHLVTGAEEVDPLANPKKWRAWKMPDRDFTFVVLDSRLWPTSQDTDIWKEWGWDKVENIYDRADPTRALLGEEQFGWLQQVVRTDAAPLICLTGINGLHTIWKGAGKKGEPAIGQRDRVAADYAGWVKAGADRVIELLAERDGITTVYGDVHNGSIIKNTEHRLIECSFGPIGRSGGRAVIPGFGPEMKDFDGRGLRVDALYHKQYSSPSLEGHDKGEPFYWNFLEMEFNPSTADPTIGFTLRNLIDAPAEAPRGGGSLIEIASESGRPLTCKLPAINTLPNADVRFVHTDGRPVRGTRSNADGSMSLRGLPDIAPGTQLIVTAFDGKQSASQAIVTS